VDRIVELLTTRAYLQHKSVCLLTKYWYRCRDCWWISYRYRIEIEKV